MQKHVITFHYTLTDKKGEQIDSSRGQNPLIFLEGSGQIIPGLETQMVNLKKGDKKKIHVPHQDAYGAYDQTLVIAVERQKFPSKEIKVGDMFEIGENARYQVVTVVEVNETNITIDGNHPLAGQDLDFDVEIMDIREATPEEMAWPFSSVVYS